MGVVVIIRFPVSDVAKAIEGIQSQAKFLEEISETTKSSGLHRHQFAAGDGELVVIDEWETAEQFQSFFAENKKVAEVMSSIGMAGEPVVSILKAMNAPGTV